MFISANCIILQYMASHRGHNIPLECLPPLLPVDCLQWPRWRCWRRRVVLYNSMQDGIQFFWLTPRLLLSNTPTLEQPLSHVMSHPSILHQLGTMCRAIEPLGICRTLIWGRRGKKGGTCRTVWSGWPSPTEPPSCQSSWTLAGSSRGLRGLCTGYLRDTAAKKVQCTLLIKIRSYTSTCNVWTCIQYTQRPEITSTLLYMFSSLCIQHC